MNAGVFQEYDYNSEYSECEWRQHDYNYKEVDYEN